MKLTYGSYRGGRSCGYEGIAKALILLITEGIERGSSIGKNKLRKLEKGQKRDKTLLLILSP